MKELKIDEGSYGDFLRAHKAGSEVVIECWEEWAGDTETGFGRGGSITLNKHDAKRLAEWILEAIK